MFKLILIPNHINLTCSNWMQNHRTRAYRWTKIIQKDQKLFQLHENLIIINKVLWNCYYRSNRLNSLMIDIMYLSYMQLISSSLENWSKVALFASFIRRKLYKYYSWFFLDCRYKYDWFTMLMLGLAGLISIDVSFRLKYEMIPNE